MTTLLEAIEILEQKVKKGKKHFIFDCGICENLSSIMNKYVHYQIKAYAKTWKDYSGDEIFPIGSEQDYFTHKELETLWMGEQLKLRTSLLSHIKKCLKEEDRIAKYNSSKGGK